MLTGDSLFVGDVARPDLAVERAEGARGIFHSLQTQLLPLPDHVEVWPGHLGGSMCGGPGMDLKVASTIGFERHHNEMLAIEDEQEFVDASVAKLGAQPPNFTAIVALNHGPLLTEASSWPRLLPRPARRAPARRRAGGRCPHRHAVRRGPRAAARSRFRCTAVASAPSWRGWRPAPRRSCSWGATTRTAAGAGQPRGRGRAG